jgi:predicted alpha-1,2-mannosidase
MPTSGDLSLVSNQSKYSDEKAAPGYYEVMLNDYNIKAELTSSLRCNYGRFIYKSDQANILFDLSKSGTQDTLFYLKWNSKKELEGCRTDGQFCGKPGTHMLYFVAQLNKEADSIGLIKNSLPTDKLMLRDSAARLGAYASYFNAKNEAIEVKIGISYVSIENARLNLEAEIGQMTFDNVKSAAKGMWQDLLSKIDVETDVRDDKVKFYTAIYHTMSHPNIINDANGDYPSMENIHSIKKVEGRQRFTLYSLWDTYRTLHPFFSLTYPRIQSQMVQSMIDMYKEYGFLPHWEAISIEKGVMNGDPSLIVINDTYQKGIRDFNVDTAYAAMIHNSKEFYAIAEVGRPDVQYIRKALQPYWENGGFISNDFKANGGDVWGVVATTQEYNLADWNLAQMARSLGKEEEYKTYMNLSKGYRFFYDSISDFFRSRNQDGTWHEPFDPYATSGEMFWDGSGGFGYVEGNAWHYKFFVPHDMQNVIAMAGGEQEFVKQLQMCFDSNYYMPTNEPDIAYPFLFNYVKGEEWRTQSIVSKLIEMEYNTSPSGIPGNDDTGTMSAWLIFAMLGIYPDCPGSTVYQLSIPAFDKISITLDNKYYKGEKFVIKKASSGNSAKNKISHIELNGKEYNKYQIEHQDIINGGELIVFTE